VRHNRHCTLIGHRKRSTVANVAVARELCGFLWAAMTHHCGRTLPPHDIND